MQADEYGQLFRNALTFAAYAAKSLSDLGRSGEWEADATACNHFAANSADAAEHLAKAMLGRHGVDYARTHDIARLAAQAEQAGLPELARSIGSMKGHSGVQHTAPYKGVSAEGCARAVARLIALAGCLGEELDRIRGAAGLSGRAGRWRRAALSRAQECREAVEAARKPAPGAPEDERARITILTEARRPLADAFGALEERLGNPDTPA